MFSFGLEQVEVIDWEKPGIFLGMMNQKQPKLPILPLKKIPLF